MRGCSSHDAEDRRSPGNAGDIQKLGNSFLRPPRRNAGLDSSLVVLFQMPGLPSHEIKHLCSFKLLSLCLALKAAIGMQYITLNLLETHEEPETLGYVMWLGT